MGWRELVVEIDRERELLDLFQAEDYFKKQYF